MIGVAVRGDAVDEADETVAVVLSEGVHAELGQALGIGTIVDDDLNLAPAFGDAAIPSQRYIEGRGIEALALPAATGGTGELTYSLAPAAPPGLVFNPTDRVLSGTPSTPMEAAFYEYTATRRLSPSRSRSSRSGRSCAAG